MRDFFKKLLCLTAVLSTLPLTFFGILLGWRCVDVAVGHRQVTAFIQHHHTLVEEWRANPQIHSVSLSHDLKQPGGLLIQFDVADKQTFLLLEDNLFSSTAGMRIPPRWDTKLRSKEDLGNDWGFAAQGIGEVGKAALRLAIASMISLLVLAVTVWGVYRPRKRQKPGQPDHA